MVVKFFPGHNISYFLNDERYEHWKKSKSANKGVDRFWDEIVEGVMIIQNKVIYFYIIKPTNEMKKIKELVDIINEMR